MFPFLSHIHVFSCEMSLANCLKWPYSFFSSHFCFRDIFVLLMFVLSVLFLVALISLPLHFLYILRVVVSMHWCYLEWWHVLILLLFLTHTVSLRHLWVVRPYASSWVFLSSVPFVEVLLSSTLRMDSSILRGAGITQVFIHLMRFLRCGVSSSSFLAVTRYSF